MKLYAELSYPYIANDARANLIKTQYETIRLGDSELTVLDKLPNPDETRDLYEPKIYNPKITGKTYFYIIQRMVESGSVNEQNEKLVRVTFNLDGRVTRVDHWGL